MSHVKGIKELLRERVAELAQYLFPNGHREGAHWCVGSIEGEPGKSFKICIAGEKAGLWGDFADSGKHYRSLLDLWMCARNVDFGTALHNAGEWLGLPRSKRTFPTLSDAISFVMRELKMLVTRRDTYHDAGANVHFVVVRFENKKKKEFRPFHQTADGWVIGDPPGSLPLFGLPKLLVPDLNPSSELVFVVEGEKCVCELETLGLHATTSAHGAKSPHKTDWQPLAGRSVVILPDNDVDGQRYAQNVASLLLQLSPQAKVKIVKLPALPTKGDCVDWLDARDAQTPEDIKAELLELTKNAETLREAGKSVHPFEGSEAFAGGVSPENESEEEEAKPFPLHCLPPKIEAICRAVVATERVPEALAGCCGLGISSASIGAGLRIKSGPNRLTCGNLLIMGSAQSGSGKSESFRHIAKPFYQFELQRLESWEEMEKPDANARRTLLEVDIKKAKKQYAKDPKDPAHNEQVKKLEQEQVELESRLHQPTLHCEDITSEKLAELLAQNDEQMASLSPDALSIVDILLGRYNKLDRTDESIYLKGFSRDPCTVHRMSRPPINLKAPCLAALWLTQPDKLQSLLDERSLNEGGLIPRILACHTNARLRKIGKNLPSIPETVEKAYAGLIFGLLETYRLAKEPFTIEATDEAMLALNDHYDAIVECTRGELRDVVSYAARWTELAWRISVNLHAGEHGAEAHTQKLSPETARRAIEIADWFAAEQLKILKAGRIKRKLARLQKLKELIVRQYNGKATLRDLNIRNGFESGEVHELAVIFPGNLVIEKLETGGRPSEIVSLCQK